jgi:hypothetical protein
MVSSSKEIQMKQKTITYEEVIDRIVHLEADAKQCLERAKQDCDSHAYAKAYGNLEAAIGHLRLRLEVENETK